MEEDAALAAAQSGTVDVAHTAASYSDMTVDGNILIQNIFCIQHTTIDLKIKDMVKWKTEQNGCRIDVNGNIVEF